MEVYDNEVSSYFLNLLFSARPNENENEFPDFIFDDGGIEHFELTSSKETKKGSAFKIEENKNKKLKEEFTLKAVKELSDPNSPFLATKNYKETYDFFTYEDFLFSLERNIVKHVNSLVKSGYQNKKNIFLMEQETARMWIDEGIVPVRFYALHNDKRALSIIKKYCSDVDYIIYFVVDFIEILDLSRIDDLLEKAIEIPNIKGGRLVKETLFVSR